MQSLEHIFDAITHPDNIKQAYLDIVLKFDKESKAGRYRGIDGLKMNDLNLISTKTLASIRDEMLALTPIAPAYMTLIPKKNGKKRKIYVYSVKERIKAEAVYRALLPFFDAYFSPFLFSYRSSHPSYYAARSAVRRYTRYYGSNHVLVTDISDYADTIDHEILMEKLSKLGMDAKALRLLELFITTDTLEEGTIVVRPRGVLTGTPLYALLSNFYMDEFDKWAGKRVAFYRRVGDDIIAMDKDRQRIVDVSERLTETVDRLKLKLNASKARLIPDTEEFKFLGYAFKGGKIGFDDSSAKKIVAGWKQQIGASKARTERSKIRHVRSLTKPGPNNLESQFVQILDQKLLVNDTEQVRELSERFFRTLTVFFEGTYSAKNRRVADAAMRAAKVPSLFKRYVTIHFLRNKNHHASTR